MKKEKLKNIFLRIEYLGTNYFGFQIQNKPKNKEPTVQEKIESALKRLFNREVKISFSSRTDRGVHAKAQGVNFKVNTNIPLSNIKKAFNSFLPEDIKIKKIKRVPLDFHSRYDAVSKLYRYIILNKKEESVFYHNLTWHIPYFLDLDRMKKAAKEISALRDFSLFAKKNSFSNPICGIKRITIKKRGSFIYIDIEANRFLRNMARNIVSLLVKVGLGKISLSDIKLILNKKTKYHNSPAPAQGLYLLKIKYKIPL